MIGVLASGEGTNLQALIDAGLPIVAVASDKPGARALERAGAAGIPAVHFADEGSMAEWLEERGVRLVVLAGYMRLLSTAFLERSTRSSTSTLPAPAFPGLRAIGAPSRRACETGVTVHLVDEGIDTGRCSGRSRCRSSRDRRSYSGSTRSSTGCCPRW
jgi:phosphoribosylglycinamide formyltransferase-1